jgi:hypothetical protein
VAITLTRLTDGYWLSSEERLPAFPQFPLDLHGKI